jgi:hypothetical protein
MAALAQPTQKNIFEACKNYDKSNLSSIDFRESRLGKQPSDTQPIVKKIFEGLK